MKTSVTNQPYYLGVPTWSSNFPIYTKHGRIFAYAVSADAADELIYSLNTAGLSFEEEDAEDLLGDLQSAYYALESAVTALEGIIQKPQRTELSTLMIKRGEGQS